MGKKTTNYEIKGLKHTLNSAYAVIKEMRIKGSTGYAIIAIQENRELALNADPYTTFSVYFTWDRKEDPCTSAYKAASSSTTRRVRKLVDKTEFDPVEEKEITYQVIEEVDETIYGPLYGWEDDIVGK